MCLVPILDFAAYTAVGFLRLADQMRLMMFLQWFELLKNVFESFLLFLQRIKVSHKTQLHIP